MYGSMVATNNDNLQMGMNLVKSKITNDTILAALGNVNTFANLLNAVRNKARPSVDNGETEGNRSQNWRKT